MRAAPNAAFCLKSAGQTKRSVSRMAERPRNILICSCDDTMPLDGEAVARVCRGADVVEGRQLCRAELETFRTVLGADCGIERIDHILAGARRCAYRITKRAESV